MYMFIEFTVSTGCFPHSDHWKSLLLNLENMCKKIESNSMLMGNICKMNNFHANVSSIVTHPKNRKFKPCNGKLNLFIILGVTVLETRVLTISYHPFLLHIVSLRWFASLQKRMSVKVSECGF